MAVSVTHPTAAPARARQATRSRAAIGAMAVFLLATAIAWARIPAVTRDTLYAEDGSHFITDWANGGSLATLFSPYAGYQHFVPRAVTGLVTLFVPVQDWAWAVNVAASAVVGAVAALVYVASRSLTRSQAARVGLAAVVVLVPLAAEESIGNLANVHWYAFFLVPFVLLARPESRGGQVGWAVVALVATLTEPQSIVFAPLAVWLLWSDRRTRLVIAGWALGLLAQVASYLSAPRPRSGGLPPLVATVKGYLVNAVLGALNAHGRVVGAVVERTGWVAPTLVLAGFLAVALVAFRLGDSRIRWATVTVVLGSVLAWLGPYLFNNQAYLYYDAPPDARGLPLIRWGMTASMFLLALVPLAAAALAPRGPTTARIGIAALVGLTAVMALSFTMANDGRLGPTWHSEIARGRAVCQAGASSVDLSTSPTGYRVAMPCSRLAG